MTTKLRRWVLAMQDQEEGGHREVGGGIVSYLIQG